MLELLACAGSPEAVTAAVQNGADAVYLSFDELTDCRKAENFADYAQGVLDRAEEAVKNGEILGTSLELPNYEGVRINFDLPEVKGWCLLRKSLHDPIMPMNAEVTEGSCEIILEIMAAFLDGYSRIGGKKQLNQ